jgi:hypothetical protein
MPEEMSSEHVDVPTGSANISQLETLRDILFGEQVRLLEQLQQRLDQTNNDLGNMQNNLQTQIDELRQLMIDQVTSELRNLIESLEKQKVSRQDLGQMLVDMGSQLQHEE